MHLGVDRDGASVRLPLAALLRHVLVLGASGSGKTVACKVLVEEAVRAGIPVIAIDPQGDIASLAEIGDVDTALAQGVPGQTMLDWYDGTDVKIWTPASTMGIPLSITPNMVVPKGAREEDRIRALGAIAANLADIAGYTRKADEIAAALAIVLEYADSHRLLIETLSDVAAFLSDPPRLLREQLDPILSAAARASLAKRLRVKLVGAQRLLFSLGKPIDVDALLGFEPGGSRDQGKVRVSVVYLNTLASPEEKELFIGALCNSVYAWMLANPSTSPQAMFYLDEAAPYLPPVRKPACKDSLMLLLRQARKFGVGCVIGSQSPGDLDYKAVGQIGTALVGRMRTHQEARKVEPLLAGMGVSADGVIDRLPGLRPGKFLLSSPDNFGQVQELQTRWLVSGHRVLTARDVAELTDEQERRRLGHSSAQTFALVGV